MMPARPGCARLWLAIACATAALAVRAAGAPQLPPAATPPPDAIRSADALASKVLATGTGTAHPSATSVVTVRYELWSDGVRIDSSEARGGKPSTWALDQVLPGLREGIALMVAGEKRRIWVPPSLGYMGLGDRPAGVLVFDVELLSIAPQEIPSKAEFTTPPASAARTPRGVRYQVLRTGTGGEHPGPLSTVTLSYVGWTDRGMKFDDSIARHQPMTAAVDTLMPGLADAVQQMVVGEKARVWIPADLAYSPPGPPRIPLVFDLELLGIQHASAGAPGTVVVQTNSRDASYVLVTPDGRPLDGKGPKTFPDLAPGAYRIKPERLKSYATGIVASPSTMVLAPGGSLTLTITYQPIVQ